MEFFKNTNFDFLGKKWPFIGLSLVLSIAGIVSMIVRGGPKYGIDFRGGALVTVRFAQRPPVEKVRGALSGKLPVEVVEVTQNNQDDIIGTDVHDDKALDQARSTIISSLNTTFGHPESGKLDLNNTGKEGIVERLRDRREELDDVRAEPQLVMLGAIPLRDDARRRKLVVRLLCEADRECVQPFRGLLRRERRQRG